LFVDCECKGTTGFHSAKLFLQNHSFFFTKIAFFCIFLHFYDFSFLSCPLFSENFLYFLLFYFFRELFFFRFFFKKSQKKTSAFSKAEVLQFLLATI